MLLRTALDPKKKTGGTMINYIYNFKNPIRHFIKIDELNYPQNIQTLPLSELAWTEPFKFRIKKTVETKRTLKIPNALNFMAAYYKFINYPFFDNVQDSDFRYKRLSANLDTGEFKTGEFDRQLALDFNHLCIFDTLLKLDIKEYYGRIYTHKLHFQNVNDELYLSNLNTGATNGLLMGNYISLYFAEMFLNNISRDLKSELDSTGLAYEFSYFSDDFYFFCNRRDHKKIISVFEKVLEEYELERNESKAEVWTYESFNSYNVVERYWKKIMSYCNTNIRIKKKPVLKKPQLERIISNKLIFLNQIIYRMSNLQDDKMKKVFINNFFKTKYFINLDLSDFVVKEYDYHQLLFIYKYSPESMLYSLSKFTKMKNFDSERLKKFLTIRFRESLQDLYHDEQLYYYFAIKICGFEDLLQESKELVIYSENQVLISYYLIEKVFNDSDLLKLKSFKDEKYWFQNYHLILFTELLNNDLEKNISEYLIPSNAKKQTQKDSYLKFYKKNLKSKCALIREIEEVNEAISVYLENKINEIEEGFEEDDE